MKFDRLDQILAGARLDAQKVGRDLTEGERVALVKGAGGFPAGCGPAPDDAPARGALRIERRKVAVIADVFDLMAARGKQRFTPSQIATARAFRFMVERHSAGGMRCASLEAAPSGGGGAGGGDWIDAYVGEGDAIRAMSRRIGAGVPLEPERAGQGRAVIPCSALVQAVCIEDLSLSAVLLRHGWKLKGRALSEAVEVLAVELGAALDRMGQTVGIGRIVSSADGGFHEGVKKSLGDLLDK